MKNSRIFLTTIFAIATTFAYSQINFGIRTGVNFANVNETAALDALTPKFHTVTGANVAGIVEFEFGEHFSIQPEISYTQKGFALREGMDLNLYNIPIPVGVTATSKFSYLEMPVLFKGKVGNDKIKAYAIAGPSIGYAVDGQLKTTANAFFEFQLTDTDIDLGAIGYEQLELSGIVGIGTEIKIPSGKIFFDARYQHGFTELYDIPVFNEKIKNQGFGLNAGYAMSF